MKSSTQLATRGETGNGGSRWISRSVGPHHGLLGVTLLLAVACGPPDETDGGGTGGGRTDSSSGGSGASSPTSGPSTSTSTSTSGGSADGSTGLGSSSDSSTESSTADTLDTLDSSGSSGSSSTGTTVSPLEPGIYVHPDGLGSNPGTAADPLPTIQDGIAAAVAANLGAVYVAAGDYEAASDAGQTVMVVSGIDLLGGFDPQDWENRDPSAYVTRIFDPSSSGETNAVTVDVAGVTDCTLDGLRIEASNLPNSLAVHIRGGAPLVQRSTIVGEVRFTQGGSATLQDNHLEHDLALRCLDSGGFVPTPVVQRNLLVGTVVWSCGGTLAANLLRGDGNPFPDYIRGLLTLGGMHSAQITSNTIVLDHDLAPPNTAIMVYGGGSGDGADEVINNNIIAPGRACISQEGSDFGNDPLILGGVRNNNLGCEILHQRFDIVSSGNPWTTDGEITSLASLHGQVDGASGNISEEPGVVDVESDWHLRTDGTTPCAVSRGGEDASATHDAADYDGEDRTVPWSIGAFEYDGACL